MLKVYKKSKLNISGFTLIETMVSFVIFVIIVSAMTATLTVALQSNKRQKEANLSQSLASSVMNSKVINQSYDYLYNYIDCHGYSLKNNGLAMLSGSTLVAATTPTDPITTCPNYDGYIYIPINSVSANSLSDPNSFPEIRKLENGSAEIQLYPFNSGTSGAPVLALDQFSAKVLARWGKKDAAGIPYRKFELATSIAKDGYFNSKKAIGCTSASDCSSGQSCAGYSPANGGTPAIIGTCQ